VAAGSLPRSGADRVLVSSGSGSRSARMRNASRRCSPVSCTMRSGVNSTPHRRRARDRRITIARILVYALAHPIFSYRTPSSRHRAANCSASTAAFRCWTPSLRSRRRGLVWHGSRAMIHAFGLLGASELGSAHGDHRGIAEALNRDRHFGLLIAMVALLPFNYLNARLEQARQLL